MPADIKTIPANKHVSLEGTVFPSRTKPSVSEAIEEGVRLSRANVTLTLVNNATIECFIFNRDAAATPPRIEVFIKGQRRRAG